MKNGKLSLADFENDVALEDEGVEIPVEVKPGKWTRVKMLSIRSDAVQRAFRQATARFRVQLESKKTDPESIAQRERAFVCRHLRALRAATLEIDGFDLAENADALFADPPADPEEADVNARRFAHLRAALGNAWTVWDQQAAEVLAEAGKGPLPQSKDA